MSIIYEALKKVEADTNSNNLKSYQPPAVKANTPLPAKKINLTFYAVIAICMISTILVAIDAYFSNRPLPLQAVKSYFDKKEIGKTKNDVYQPAKITTTQAKTEMPSAGNVIAVANSASNTSGSAVFILQGIIYDDNSPFAIINGKTVRKSEAIGDFVVIDIAPTVVTLKNSKDNKELTLSF